MLNEMTAIKKVHLNTERLGKIARGDWQTYIAPMFHPMGEETKGKADGSIVPVDVRRDVLERARMAMIGNASVRLDQKLELVQKVESIV